MRRLNFPPANIQEAKTLSRDHPDRAERDGIAGIRPSPFPCTQQSCPRPVVILAEVRCLCAELDRFKKVHNDFAVRTTNDIDELFAKIDARVQADLAGSRLAQRRRPFASNGRKLRR